jgi:hypothetical protein
MHRVVYAALVLCGKGSSMAASVLKRPRAAFAAETPLRMKSSAPRIVPVEPLFSLPLADLRETTVLARPSRRNKSPFVADALLRYAETDAAREVLVHVPSLDLGGKAAPGARLLVRVARDGRTGAPVGADATSPKYGTPKCEFIAALCRV